MENQIKTTDDAFNALNLDPAQQPDVSMLPEEFQKPVTSFYILIVVNKALNLSENGEEWQPDWSNFNERKYYPWFDMNAKEKDDAGVGFSFDFYVCVYSGSSVGSRLCYRSAELAKYAGNQFRDLYKDIMVL